jgi:7-cyano-7-deazaguanine synthase in queuosine biosynthesis
MKINLPQLYFSKLMRAIVEFDMIQEGDNILIGVSGGKDSIFLVYALAIMRQRLKKNFSLSALTINPMFTSDFDTERIKAYCESLEVPYDTVDVDIAGAIKAQADKVIAEFEASQKLGKKLNGILESIGATKKPADPRQQKIDSILESVSKKETSKNKLAEKLNGILEGVDKSIAAAKKADDFDKKLDAIVAEVKNA